MISCRSAQGSPRRRSIGRTAITVPASISRHLRRATMTMITVAEGATWAIAAVATGGVIARPWRLPEAIWAVLGAASLVVLALVPWRDALSAIGDGTDVYLFLAGMMLLAELARQQGVFDWLAALAAAH